MLPVFSKSSQAIFAAPFSVFLSRILFPPFHSLRGAKGFYADCETGHPKAFEIFRLRLTPSLNMTSLATRP